jgi:hypothetical protein
MTEEQQEERRRQIKEIMGDQALSQQEKSKAIQSLMDGRRRSSFASACSRRSSLNSVCSPQRRYSSMSRAAAIAAADFANLDNDEDDDAVMNEASDDAQSITVSVATASATSHTTASINETLPSEKYHPHHPVRERRLSLQEFNDSERTLFAAHQNVLADSSRLMEQSRPVCSHYERNCTLISPCCGLAFGCRICHDECPVLPPPIVQRQNESSSNAIAHHSKVERRRSLPIHNDADEETHHLIDRFAVKEVICRECHTRQGSKT